MDSSELQQNFLYACLKYAYDNGGIETNYTTFSPDYVGIEYRDNTYTIVRWNHDSTQPSVDDLMAYSVTDLADVKKTFENHSLLKKSKCAIAGGSTTTSGGGASQGSFMVDWDNGVGLLHVLDSNNEWKPLYSSIYIDNGGASGATGATGPIDDGGGGPTGS